MVVLEPGEHFDPRKPGSTGERIPLDHLIFPQSGVYRLTLSYCTINKPLSPGKHPGNEPLLSADARALLDFVPEGMFTSEELVITVSDPPSTPAP
ncbi:MAG: hypothetical protein FLDDKLPJ_03279 [Phycisphaerae bacterium]|nr:hypothetical protein [Phycisphaerae bacterium]